MSALIKQHYTRAINIQRDNDNDANLAAYLPTPRALQTLRQIADTFGALDCPRAWSLIGPYGAGKSAFAVFLSALLAGPNRPGWQTALDKLKTHDAELEQRYQQAFADGGCLRVHLNGSPDPLAPQLLHALCRDVESQCPDLDANLLKRLKRAAHDGCAMGEIGGLLQQLQQELSKHGYRGLMLLIDELGKFLEYQAYHPHSQDLHLLQLLAEHSHSHQPAKLYLVTLLHQAFEQYAHGAGRRRKDEWQKVQGRFATVPFVESADQILRIIATAFAERPLDAAQAATFHAIATTLDRLGALPAQLQPAIAADWFARCQPLHPITLLILPSLCQKVAQNERTLFTYLGSQETYGFQHALANLPAGENVQPWQVYDYFVLNQASALTDAFTHHRWMEVVTALDRLGAAAEADTVRLLKTIGLLNIIGGQGGLKASPELLGLCGVTDIAHSLRQLLDASCIQLRKFNNEYRVWQGSDFDLLNTLLAAMAPLHSLNLAAQLNAQRPLAPLVARRVSIHSGSLRYFLPHFTDRNAWPSVAAQSATTPRLWIYLRESDDDKPEVSLLGEHDALVIYPHTERLREAACELTALEHLPRQHPALRDDPVARHEYLDWLGRAQQTMQRLLIGLLDQPQQQHWYYAQGVRQTIHNKRDLQRKLSEWMEQTYRYAPQLKNELINRDSPSTSANTGRKKLLIAMLEHPAEANLGLIKDPAEKSMYKALLHATGLHRQINGQWQFTTPPQYPHDRCNLRPSWDAITAFLSHQPGPQPLPALYQHLRQPPYGLKTGVLPILIVAYLLAESRNIALYQEHEFSPGLSPDAAELLCRRPELFSIERLDLGGVRGDLFRRYLQSIIGHLADDASPLDIVRPLARFIIALPEHSRQTARLSREARQVRDTLKHAKNPGKLLFHDLPAACGFADLAADSAENKAYIDKLAQALRELSHAYDTLLRHWQQRVSLALLERAEPDLSQLRRQAAARFNGLEHLAPTADGLGPLIRRLTSDSLADQPWLESIGTLLARVPPNKWNDDHLRQAETRLAELGERLRDFASLHTRRDTPADNKTILLKTLDAENEIRRVIYLTPEEQEMAAAKARDILNMKEGWQELSKTVKLGILAELMKRYTE